MPTLNRKDLEVRYHMFDHFALDDQRKYYKATSAKFRRSASQVNRIRAMLAFFTGFAAAAAALIVQSAFINGATCTVKSSPGYCGVLLQLTGLFTIASITLPAFAALFSTLADLYQWDRLITIYDSAQENIEVADAYSPELDIQDDVRFVAAFTAYVEGTLSVMKDEASQWGQAIRTPVQLEKYVEDAEKKTGKVLQTVPAGAAAGLVQYASPNDTTDSRPQSGDPSSAGDPADPTSGSNTPG